MSDIKIVEFVCDAEEQHSDSAKMIKILNWKSCMNVVTACDFLELCIYYWIWIKNFTLVTELIYWLMCQQWSVDQQKKTLFSIWVSVLWQKIEINIIYMSSNQNKHFLMIAWDDLSEWVETRALSNADSSSVAKFLYEDIICRHSCFSQLVVDGELKNKEFVEVLSEKYKIHWLIVSAYHSQANEMIKRDHLLLLMLLSKMFKESFRSWVKNLLTVLWVNKMIIQWSTELTSYYMLYEMNAVLSIKLDVLIWHVLSWNKVQTMMNLLAVQVQQIQCRDENLKKVTLHLQRMQLKNKKFFDDNHRIWTERIKNDDLILLHNTKRDTDMFTKLTFHWLEFFQILKSVLKKEMFILEELDDTRMTEMFAENRLKIYWTCEVVVDAISTSENCINQKTIHNVRERQEADKAAVFFMLNMKNSSEQSLLSTQLLWNSQVFISADHSFAVMILWHILLSLNDIVLLHFKIIIAFHHWNVLL